MSDGTGRRLLVAVTAIVVAATMLRPQISAALVVRGDEFLYRSQPSASLGYYRRALVVDSDDAAAIDRLAFVASVVRDRSALGDAIAGTTSFLARHPQDDAIRLDRAMIYRLRGDAQGALDDFARAGAAENDPRALTFAGYSAYELGRTSLARRFWHAALSAQPGFVPALHALERHGGLS